MNLSRPVLTLLAVCAALILLSVLGIVFDFTTLMAFHPDLDGILLLFVCLIMGGLFSLMLFLLAKEEGWLPGKKRAADKAK